MSTTMLVELQRCRAFDPTLPFEELGALHVPFDVMHGGHDVEAVLARAVRCGDRVALIGTTGNGKSSTAAHTVRPTLDHLVGFRIGVTVEDANVLANPGRFAQHVVRRIARDAAEVPGSDRARLRAEVTDVHEVAPNRSRRGSAKLSAKVVELSAELGSVADAVVEQTSSFELIGALDHALDLVRSTGAAPVLVIDDSDTWIEVGDGRVAAARRLFFGPIVRMLAERGCALVVAVDERYLASDDYRRARDGSLPVEVAIPRIASSDGLRLLLERRIEQVDGASMAEIFPDTAAVELYRSYSAGRMSLRALMRCVSGAVYHAVAAGADHVGREAIGASLREYLAERHA